VRKTQDASPLVFAEKLRLHRCSDCHDVFFVLEHVNSDYKRDYVCKRCSDNRLVKTIFIQDDEDDEYIL